MDKTNNTIITHIERFFQDKAYFSSAALERHLKQQGLSFRRLTLNQHLYNLKTKQKLFDSGRGWYSTIAQQFTVDRKPLKKMAVQISQDFPLLEFAVWNTRQIASYFHHLPSRHLTFIYTHPDAFGPLFELLLAKGYRVYRDPKKKIIEEHWIPDTDTIIIRPSVSEAPLLNEGSWRPAAIEKILVDLYEEKDKLYYMEGAEFERIFHNIILSARINISMLLRYCYRRSRKQLRQTFEELLAASGGPGIVNQPSSRGNK